MVPCKLMQLLLCAAAASAVQVMEVKFSWASVDYVFSSPEERQTAIDSKTFVPENCVVLDVDSFECTGCNSSIMGRRVFVTVPRVKPGVPATLAELVPGEDSNTTLLAPFPNWDTNTVLGDSISNCDEIIISVFRTKVDNLGRFWVLDVGTLDQFSPTVRSVCPPKLLIYDLRDHDNVTRVYSFSTSYLKDRSLFTNLVVDIKDPKGEDTFAYIADTAAYKLVVYDLKNDDSWVIDQAYFYPYPTAANFDVNGVKFNFMDGVLGLALSPVPVAEEKRTLYFHSYASKRESWVETSVLQNKSMFQNGLIDGTDVFFVSEEVREFQSTVEVMTNDGILISTSMDNSLVCWDRNDPFTADKLRVVYKNDENFQFPTGMKIVGDDVWAVSSQLQNLLSPNPFDPDSIKYRVLVCSANDLVNCVGCT